MQRRRKILFLIESMIAGGAERALINLVNALPEDKFDITLCAVFKESVYPGYKSSFNDKINSNIKVRFLFDNSTSRKSRFSNIILNRVPKKVVHKLLLGCKYDTEVAFYEGLPTEFLSYSSNKKSKKIAWLHTMTELSCPDKTKLPKIRRIYSNYDSVVGVSKACIQSFENSVNSSNKEKIVINNLLEVDEIIKLSKEKPKEEMLCGDVTFVCVGRICHVKGYDRLMDAAEKLSGEGYDFAVNIIGGGKEIEVYRNLVKDKQLERHIKFLGHQDNPYAYIANSDCYLCTSRIEGFSLCIQEAMILKCPILSVEFPAIHETLHSKKELAHIVENSTEGIYAGIKDIICDKNMLSDIKEAYKSFEFKKAMNDNLTKSINLLWE